jgi:Tol biopolymer transport system component
VLASGHRIGPYVVVSPLGSGGMGEVYLADDTRLRRRVALKVLSAGSESGTHASERLLREAQAAARLDHTNICTIFDTGEADGQAYIAMQFVEGESVAARLKRKPLDLREALSLGAEVAHALAEAHRQGIVHRDVKPENVMVTTSGHAKVLDFGLAQLTGPLADGATTFERLTRAGAVAGTVRYMSPEQVKGEPIDERSDLFSLGVVLHEVLLRAHPFAAASVAETIAAILGREAPRLADHVPPEVRRIVAKCLEKDRERRYQSARDLAIDLDAAERDLSAARAPAPGTSDGTSKPGNVGIGRVRWVAAVSVLAIVAFMVANAIRDRPGPLPDAAEYVQVTNRADSAAAPAISRDGAMVAFLSGGAGFLTRGQVYVKRLPNGDTKQLTTDPRPKYGLSFSPDGNRVAYTVVDRGGWSTWSVPVIGGEATQVLPNAAGLTWIDNRHLLFSEIKTGLHMGVVTATTAREGRRSIYFPAHERAMAHYSALSPDRRWLLITEMNKTGGWDRCRVVPFAGAAAGREVGPPGSCQAAAWSPDGSWMYFAVQDDMASHLWRQRFPTGAPEALTSGPATDEQGLAVAPDGRSLITAIGRRSSSVWLHDADGARPLSSEGFAIQPRFSRDGQRVFCLVRGSGSSILELQAIDLASRRMDAIMPGVSMSQFDVSPDETTVAYATRSAGGESQVWIAPLDRTAPPRLLVPRADSVFFAGNELIYRELEGHANFLGRIGRDGSGRARVVEQPVVDVVAASPDGRWAVVQVATLSMTAISVSDGESSLVCGGYCAPAWSRDGRHLFLSYLAPSPTVVAPVPAGQAFPEFPADGTPGAEAWSKLPGVRRIDVDYIAAGSDPLRYVTLKIDHMRNLFRIPIR